MVIELRASPDLPALSRAGGCPDRDFGDHPPPRTADAGSTVMLGSYELLGIVGRGGSATVYRARHAVLNKEVAIKVLERRYASDACLRQRFLGEAKALGHIRHPNVIGVLDCIEANHDLCYSVMELLHGSPLSRLIERQGPLEPGRAARLMLQLCDALAAVHACGIVHRDVKPENLLITANGDEERLTLLDFGIAHLPPELETGCLTLPGVAMGTLEYMAPEQTTNAGEPSAKADIYAMGGVLYSMLTARVPHPVQSVQERKMHDGRPTLPPLAMLAGAEMLYALALSCMSDEPEARPAQAAGAKRLVDYPEHTAGGIMITEYLSFPEHLTVGGVLDALRANTETYQRHDVQYIYVTGAGGALQGVLRLRDLVLTTPNVPVRDIMVTKMNAVPVDAPLEALHDFFASRPYRGVPVVDDGGRLLGVVRHADVAEALGEQAASDHLKAQGIVGGEELRSMPVLTRAWRRLSWLSVNILLNILAATIIALYQETLSTVIVLAVFLPIISDMSGCSGNQAIAVSMRELTLGIIRPADALRVWRKELSVGLINAAALGILLGLAAFLWKGNLTLSLVVGIALALNTVVAVSLGGLVPLLLRRLRKDPALASGPLLTTVTDMCGFFFVLSFASAVLPALR